MTNQTAKRFGYPDTTIQEYDHWIVLLRQQQITLGSLVMCAKSEVTEFSALPEGAYAEMGLVIQDIERVLRETFEYEKINYLMLMMVDPNVHFHVLPRYSGSRSACGLTIIDHGWPAAPKLDKARDLNAEEVDKLCNYVRDRWQCAA
ncbi:MAG: HIT family protein [Leptolyngbya sp. SIO1D8]|nr:HIT family protein [Leptolyngbya sp. SIO1D8]